MVSQASHVKMWKTNPTMTRGRKKLHPNNAAAKPKAKAKAKAKLARFGKEQKKKVIKDVFNKEKGALVAANSDDEEDLMTAKRFRRTEKGRQAIQGVVRMLCKLDSKQFSTSPIFGIDGLCRMRHASANGLAMKDMIEAAPFCWKHRCNLDQFAYIYLYF